MRGGDAYVALGSNLGDRRAFLEGALATLDGAQGVRVLACSRFYETEPVGPPPQGPYLNAVARLETPPYVPSRWRVSRRADLLDSRQRA